MITAEEIRRLLHLRPLPHEGGWFAEVHRASGVVPGTTRALSSAIYYLVEPQGFSALHRLDAEETFHFYLGDPVEMLQLGPGDEARVLHLGGDLAAGERPLAVVPAGAWQGTRLRSGGRWALLGTTMAPAYETGGFELGRRAELVARWPAHRTLIEALTRG